MDTHVELRRLHIANRPTRCAYVVLHDDDFGFLSKVIEHACGWWGGGWSPIVPLGDHGRLMEPFAQILAAFDPDFVLAARPQVSPELQEQIRSVCAPFDVHSVLVDRPGAGTSPAHQGSSSA